jgi:SynChlorMet cassette radical SAM/SPASM protein ScmE
MRIKPLRAPEMVFVALTSECNLHCKHCNVYPFRESRSDFTFEEWTAFFRRLQELSVLRVWLSGGEPFCREDVFDLLGDLHARPLHIDGLNTNATLIGREEAKRLAGFRKLGTVQVGLDGAGESSHDRLRGRGVFGRAVRGITHLVEAGLGVSLFTVVTRLNRGELRDVLVLARDLGVAGVTFSLLLPQGRALHYGRELGLNLAEWRGTVNEMGEMLSEFPGLAGGPLVDMYRMFEGFEERLGEIEERGGTCLSGCKTGITECTVMSDGRVLPCDRLQDVVVGDLREMDLEEIWLHSPAFEDFRRRFEVLLDDLPACRSCSYQPLCTGGCPALPFYLEGTLLARDPFSCYRLFKGEEDGEEVLRVRTRSA